MLTLGFDTTILNVALPTMAADLGATTGQQQWMADSYVVVFAALMLPAGLLGDRFGRRPAILAAMALFGVCSFAAAFARSHGGRNPPRCSPSPPNTAPCACAARS
jgi:MFS family permease